MTTAATILSRMSNPGASTYYSPEFRRVLEDFLPQLVATATQQPVESFDAYKYEGVFFDYLEHLKIPHASHWVIMRVNNMTSPTQFDGKMKFMLLPDMSKVETIHSNFKTQYRVRS